MPADDREHTNPLSGQDSNLPLEDWKPQDVDPAAAEQVKGGFIQGLVQPVILISMADGGSGGPITAGTKVGGTAKL